jgi:hypothetical protein
MVTIHTLTLILACQATSTREASSLEATRIGGTFEYPGKEGSGRCKERLVTTFADDRFRVDMGDRCSVVGSPRKWLFLDHKRKIGLELTEIGNDRFWGWQVANEICPLWPSAYGWADSRSVYEGMMEGYEKMGDTYHYKAEARGEGAARMNVTTVWGYVNWGGLQGTTTFGVLESEQVPHTRLWRFQADSSPAQLWSMEYESAPTKTEVERSLFEPPPRYSIAHYNTTEFKENKVKPPFSQPFKPRDWLRSLYAAKQIGVGN